MTKIVDPDLLNQGVEIVFDTAARTIELAVAGNLSDDGVAIQAIYSFCKEEWSSDSALIKIPFPLKPIDGPSGTQFDLIAEWSWKNAVTTGLIRDGGWAKKAANGDSQEEWMNLTSLGSFLEPGDQAHFTQGDADNPVDISLTGPVNQAIQVYGDGGHGNFDYRGDFIIYLREQGKTFAQYDLLVEQNITALTYKKYATPLSNGDDTLKVTNDDGAVGSAPYTNITVEYFGADQAKNISGSNYNFRKIIEGDNKTLEQIYEKIMYLLRQTSDIDSGAGSVRGDTADPLLYFVGDTLYTNLGVFIENVLPADLNRVVFLDQSGVERTYAYAAAGAMSFNLPLQNAGSAIYRMFFTNDDAGDNLGNDYGTDNAVLVNDNSGAPISGTVSGQPAIAFDYDYDGNVQRGAASAGTDVPVTLVALGTDSAQYVIATGTITRSKSNNFGFVASDELTYVNP